MSDFGKAVFLSYASQDAEAARRICEALRAAGVEVWFDQSELRGGDAWDAKIRKQIKECALFVPVISANTQARLEGYFRLEWKLAEDRSHLMAKGKPFIVPVAVDDTRDAEAHVPDAFLAVQWMRINADAGAAKFAARVNVLLQSSPDRPHRDPMAPLENGKTEVRKSNSTRRAFGKRFWLGVAASLVVIAVALITWSHSRQPAANSNVSATASRPGVTPPDWTPRDPDLAKAWALVMDPNFTWDDLTLAEDTASRALQARPGDGDAAIALTWAQALSLSRGWDDDGERNAAAVRAGERAVRLAGINPWAQAGLALALARHSDPPRAEKLARAATEKDPRMPRFYGVLSEAVAFRDRSASIRLLTDALDRFPNDALTHFEIFMRRAQGGQIEEGERELDRSLALDPTGAAMIFKGAILFRRGDVAGVRRLLDRLPDAWRQADRAVFYRYLCATLTGDFDDAITALQNFPGASLRDFTYTGPKNLLLGDLLILAGQEDRGKALLETELASVRQTAKPLIALVLLGRRNEALRVAESAAPTILSPPPDYFAGEPFTWFSPLQLNLMLGRREQALAIARRLAASPRNRRAFGFVLQHELHLKSWRDDAELRTVFAEPEDSKPSSAAAAAPDPKSVVVLPFANLSGDPAQEYFSDGLTEEILNALARERDLRVVPRTSAFSFKGKNLPLPEIARALNVAQVVEGSVRRAGNTVRIDCTLTRVSDGFAQPLPQFQREMKDASGIFALEDEVARAVVQKLTLRGTMTATDGGTSNWEAYDRFLRARALQVSHATGPSGYRAMREYEEVVRLDPGFGLAWAQLAEVAAGLGAPDGGFDMSESTRARAVEAANQAVRLAPNLADAHVARAVVCLIIEQNSDEAARELHEADLLQPFNAGLARVRATVEAPTASNARLLELVTRAAELDPQNTNTLTAMGQLLWRRGEFAHADEFARRATVVGESQNAFLTRGLNWAAWTGNIRQALAIVDGCPEPFRNELFYRILAPLYEEEGDEAEAVAMWEKAREMAEKEIQTPGIRSAHVLILTALGRHARVVNAPQAKLYFDEARRELDVLLQEQPRTFNIQMRQVQWLAGQAKFSEALAALETIESSASRLSFHAPGNLTGISKDGAADTKARLLAALGKTDAAIDQLQRMEAGGVAFGYALRLTPEFKSLRGVPAFESLMRDAEARANAMPHPKE